MQSQPLSNTAAPASSERFIYIASPWTPVCGGIYKVVDYLVQLQAREQPADGAHLTRPVI